MLYNMPHSNQTVNSCASIQTRRRKPMAKKLTKAERKSQKAAAKNEKANATGGSMNVVERDLGYDADFYVSTDSAEEIEAVRVDFVAKPKWYNEMFFDGRIHYRSSELQVQYDDGSWHAGKDLKCVLARRSDGSIVIIGDEELNSGWKKIATSTSRLNLPKCK